MKKFLFSFLIILFSGTYCRSQNQGYFSLQVGSSIPSGNFGEAYSTTSGFAKTGRVYEFSFACKLSKNVGLTSMIFGESHSFDDASYLDHYNKLYPNISWAITSDFWKIGGLFFGAYGSIDIWKEKISIELRTMPGILHARSPEVSLVGKLGKITEWESLSSKPDDDFTYLAGFGLKYNLSNTFCLLANLDYTAASFEFDGVELSTNFRYYNVGVLKQDFGVINLAGGIGLRF